MIQFIESPQRNLSAGWSAADFASNPLGKWKKICFEENPQKLNNVGVRDPTVPNLEFDVIVVGGALAGASAALLLLREDLNLKILIIEKSDRFSRKVGESTVEVSAYFLTRVLGLTSHLNESHLVKQGMRFWFQNAHTSSLAECSEIGGSYLARLPAFQIDRSVIDEEVLSKARDEGAAIWRPATVSRIDLHRGGRQSVTVSRAGQTCVVTGRWVIDASGIAAVLARQEGWMRRNELHPISAAWARWRHVANLDGVELARKHPAWASSCKGMRMTATNHIVGDGWWAWCIPLKGGDTSVGVVFDQRLVQWPSEGRLGDRLRSFLLEHPFARELLANAEYIDGDVYFRGKLPYCSTTFAGDGFVLTGDAAGFLDPFYSPGLDWLAYTVTSAVRLVLEQKKGQDISSLLPEYNARFDRCYRRWFQAVYQDKYHYMGDYDLMRLAFLLDIGLYYLGVVMQPYRRGSAALTEAVFTKRVSVPFFWLMKTYNRRFSKIGHVRRLRGTFGSKNHGHRFLFGGFTLGSSAFLPLVRGLRGWLWLELKEGWQTWLHREIHQHKPLPRAVPTLSE